MDFGKKNDFVVLHTTDKYFDKDLMLYKKCFPASNIIPHLEAANEFNKKDLDGRMLLEMLDVVCGETIIENRGIVKAGKKKAAPGDKQAELDHLKALKREAIGKQNYKDVLKPMALALDLKLPDMKKATIIEALTRLWVELNPEPEPKKKEAQD